MKKTKGKILFLMIAALSMFAMAGCGSKKDAGQGTESTPAATETVKETPKIDAEAETSADTTAEPVDEGSDDKKDDTEYLSGKHHVEIEVKNYGTISVELDADVAPISVTNFVNLAKEGFYDGLTFHRIIDGFMIQGGDPLGNGTGGSDETIKGEFSANGVENNISHVRGTISMARAMDNDSASSQFFIVQSDSLSLDGSYAGFGTVTEGMDIIDKICKDVPVQDDNGTVLAEDQPVITTITVVD